MIANWKQNETESHSEPAKKSIPFFGSVDHSELSIYTKEEGEFESRFDLWHWKVGD
jgi:hypothetical protein